MNFFYLNNNIKNKIIFYGCNTISKNLSDDIKHYHESKNILFQCYQNFIYQLLNDLINFFTKYRKYKTLVDNLNNKQMINLINKMWLKLPINKREEFLSINVYCETLEFHYY